METPIENGSVLIIAVNIATKDPFYSFVSNAPLMLKASLMKSGMDSEAIQTKQFRNNARAEFIARVILKADPKVVCFSLYIWNYQLISEIVRIIKESRPDIISIVGGPFVEFGTEECLKNNPWYDIAVHSDAINTLPALITSLKKRQWKIDRSTQIKGIGLNGKTVKLAKGRNHTHIKDSPSIILNDSLFKELIPNKRFSMTYETSSGCPHNCHFCQWTKGRVASLPIPRVFKELSRLFKIKNLCKIYITDPDLLMNRPRAEKILSFIASNKPDDLILQMEVNPENLTSSLSSIISRCRNMILSFAIQTLNPRALKLMNRRVNVKRIMYNLDELSNKAFRNNEIRFGFIYGLPGDDLSEFMKSIDAVIRVHSKFDISRLILLPGSRYYKDKKKLGLRTYKGTYLVSHNQTFQPYQMEVASKISFYLRMMYYKKNLIVRYGLKVMQSLEHFFRKDRVSYLRLVMEYYDYLEKKMGIRMGYNYTELEESSPYIDNLQKSERVHSNLSQNRITLGWNTLAFFFAKFIDIVIPWKIAKRTSGVKHHP